MARVLLFALTCLLAGCSRPVPPADPSSVVIDTLGRPQPLGPPPTRIVSLAASNTEVLFALGLNDEIVGVTEFCTYPPAATTKPRVGGFAAETFSDEAILALKPDLVLADASFQLPLVERLERLGLRVAAFDAPTVEGVYENIEKIGRLVGRADAAGPVVERMKVRLARVAERVRDRPRPAVFYLVSDNPLMTAGPRTVIHDVLDRAGGTNAFADVGPRYPQVSLEELLRRDPPVVVVPRYGHDDHAAPPNLPDRLTAVRTGRVYAVNADLISRQTPRLADVVERLAELLHPPR